MNNLCEKTVMMGADQSLTGILSEPCTDSDADTKPAFIILNAGLLHHVGQNRMSVTLSRQLACQGRYALRFDLSGIGDSASRRSELSFQERAITEVREAMDYLQANKGIDRFVLCGLCTGADNAFRTAIVDPRVSGVITIEGYAYQTAAYNKRKYIDKAFNLNRWKNRLSRYSGRLGKQEQKGEVIRQVDVSYHWMLPPIEQMAASLQTLIERKVGMLMVYVGNNSRYNYQGQFADAFSEIDFNGLLKESYYEKSDHNFSMESDRDRLCAEISDWIGNLG